MQDLTRSFKNKRVFLTGHTGFKGSWMAVWLMMMGAKVKGYALKPEKDSLFSKIRKDLKLESVIDDIRNKERLKKEILDFKPDYIFHLAAQPLVRESYVIPVETFHTNIIGTAHVLDSLRYLKKKCICVIVTTDKVYENFEKDYAYKESDRLGGYDPYSASKAAAEIITDSYRLSFFNPAEFRTHQKSVASARAGNVIGGGDYSKDRIVPDMFRALSSSKTIKVRNPNAVRPWQHVLEPLSGYLALAAAMDKEPARFAGSYNFGPELNDICTVQELVTFALKCWGTGKYQIASQAKAPHEAGLLKLDINKAKHELGFGPKWNANSAIKKTMDWYKKSMEKNSHAIDLCKADVKAYLGK